ncbi:MAG: hypothetical protein A4S12_09065 [Proteobacteria bacterium SG_bin5]|nr:hypothetical protein [Sphingomonas sp.]OQW41154.1 MAG: hypothetical protein A4S12_09065 [Proteobacteria bacterium SG_bin5]
MRFAIGALALIVAAPAAAQNVAVSQQIQFAGDAPSACVVGAARAGALQNATVGATDTSSASVQITELADPNTAVARPAVIRVSFAAICTAANNVTVTSRNGGMRRVGAVAGATDPVGFTQVAPYQLTVTWSGASASGASGANTPLTLSAGQAVRGDLGLELNFAGGGAPLVSGTYEDTVTVEVKVAG